MMNCINYDNGECHLVNGLLCSNDDNCENREPCPPKPTITVKEMMEENRFRRPYNFYAHAPIGNDVDYITSCLCKSLVEDIIRQYSEEYSLDRKSVIDEVNSIRPYLRSLVEVLVRYDFNWYSIGKGNPGWSGVKGAGHSANGLLCTTISEIFVHEEADFSYRCEEDEEKKRRYLNEFEIEFND